MSTPDADAHDRWRAGEDASGDGRPQLHRVATADRRKLRHGEIGFAGNGRGADPHGRRHDGGRAHGVVVHQAVRARGVPGIVMGLVIVRVRARVPIRVRVIRRFPGGDGVFEFMELSRRDEDGLDRKARQQQCHQAGSDDAGQLSGTWEHGRRLPGARFRTRRASWSGQTTSNPMPVNDSPTETVESAARFHRIPVRGTAFDLPTMASMTIRSAGDRPAIRDSEMKLFVEGMTCGHCVGTITAALRRLDADARIDVDLANAEVHVESDRVSAEAAIDAIQREGYIAAANAPDSARRCCGTCHG